MCAESWGERTYRKRKPREELQPVDATLRDLLGAALGPRTRTRQPAPIPMTQRMYRPREVAEMQQQTESPEAVWREELRKAALKHATDKAAMEEKEQAELAKEQRQAELKQAETMQKRQFDLQDKLAAAKTEEERAAIQAQLDQHTASQSPALSDEEAAAIQGAINVKDTQLAEIERRIAANQRKEVELNTWLNSGDLSPKDRKALRDRLGKLRVAIHRDVQQRDWIKGLAERAPELEAHAARKRQEARKAQEELIKELQQKKSMEEIQRTLEEWAKRPVETREEEAARKRAEDAARLAELERAKTPYDILREKRIEDREKRLADYRDRLTRASKSGDSGDFESTVDTMYKNWEKYSPEIIRHEAELDQMELEQAVLEDEYRGVVSALATEKKYFTPNETEVARLEQEKTRLEGDLAAKRSAITDKKKARPKWPTKADVRKQIKKDMEAFGAEAGPEAEPVLGPNGPSPAEVEKAVRQGGRISPANIPDFLEAYKRGDRDAVQYVQSIAFQIGR